MKRGLAVALVVCASGCAIGPNYYRPELPTPPTFRDAASETESIADLPWFEIFRDGVLDQLVREALASNRDLVAAAERVEQARSLAAVSRSALFPEIGYEHDVAHGHDTQLGLPTPGRGTGSDYLAALSVAWELDIWGRIRRANEAARAEMLASEAVRRGVVLTLVTDVARAYFELLELDLELEIAHQNEDTFRESRDLFVRQYNGGVASKLDALRGEAALAQVSATVPSLEQQIVAKENQLCVLLGRAPGPLPRGDALVDQTEPPPVAAGIPSQLLERRPDLIQAEQTLHSANARVGEALGEFFPRIGLTSVIGSTSDELGSMLESGTGYWAVVAQAIGPIFTFGRNWYNWRASQRETDAARAEYEQTVLVALQETSDALIAREKLVLVREHQQMAVDSLEGAVSIARTRYLGGLATYIEVLDAQQQLFPAQLDLARTRRDQWVALVALYRALGGGWSQEPPPPSVPQPIAP